MSFHLSTGKLSIGATCWMPGVGVRHHRGDLVLAAEIGPVEADPRAGLGEPRDLADGAFGVPEAVQHDARALLGESHGDREPDAARGARDEGGLPVEHHDTSAPFAATPFAAPFVSIFASVALSCSVTNSRTIGKIFSRHFDPLKMP